MTPGLIQLAQRRVEKPWGMASLPEPFSAFDGTAPVGEIWFEHPAGRDLPLLIKYLFTSERLSIQVHPDDNMAARQGHARGKDEAWLVLSAEEEARLGVGLTRAVDADALRAAALDGSIEQLLDWRTVGSGDAYYSPAGTVHAIGAGLVLLEVQQNADLTYRLYDYGRPRELHLDESIAAANPAADVARSEPRVLDQVRAVVAEGRAFTMERWTGPGSLACDAAADRPVWLVPLEGSIRCGDVQLEPGTAWLAEGPLRVELAPAGTCIAAYLPGACPISLEAANGW